MSQEPYQRNNICSRIVPTSDTEWHTVLFYSVRFRHTTPLQAPVEQRLQSVSSVKHALLVGPLPR